MSKHGKSILITRRLLPLLLRNRHLSSMITRSSNIDTINMNTNNTKTADSQVMILPPSSLYDSSSRFSGARSSRRHWSSSAFSSTTSPPADDDDDEGERRGTRVRSRNEMSLSLSSTSTARENNTSSTSSNNSIFTQDCEQLAIDRMVLGGGGIDEWYKSIDVDSVVTEGYLQRLFDDHISHTTTTSNNNNSSKNNTNNNQIPPLPNPNMLLNMLEMLRNEEANISNDTILKIFRQVVQSKRVKLLERAEDVVVKNKYDPQLLRLLIAGYVNANAAERACTLLMEWPNESSQHQPGIKSYRLVLTALSSSTSLSSSTLSNNDYSNNKSIGNNEQKRLKQKKNNSRHNDPNNNNQGQQDSQYEENNNNNKDRLAHRLLLHMCRNHIKFPKLSLTPDRDCFHRVLGACTSIESLSTAEQVLDDMMRFANGEEVVDTTATTTMTGDNIIYNSGDDIIRIPAPIDTYPTKSAIRQLIKGWTATTSNNGNNNYEERKKKSIKMQQAVFEFLRRIEEKEALSPLRQHRADSSSSSIVDIDCYNVILNVIAELGQYELAENIFYRLLTDYLKDKSNVQPDAVTLHTVLKSHVKAYTKEAAFAAENFIQRLDDFHDQQEKIQKKARYCFIDNDDEDDSGSSNNYNIVTEDGDTEDKAGYTSSNGNSNINHSVTDDAIVNNNSQSNSKTPRLVDNIQPTARARTTILNLWIKLGQPKKAIDILTKAESIYQKKLHKQQNDDDHRHQNDTNNNIERFKPDKISYHQIIGALSNIQKSSPTVGLAVQAEEIAERMSIIGHSVNIRTCNTILNCWTKSGNPDRAESFMEETMSHYETPDIVSYNTIINGYARLGNLNRSLELLTRLLDDSLISNTNNNSLLLPKPNSRTFTSILTALSREKTVRAAEEAEKLLLQMQELYDSPYNLDTRPNIITYNAIMNCWASLSLSLPRPRQRSQQQRIEQDDRNGKNNDNNNKDYHHYGRKAEFVLRSIQGLDDKDERPDVTSYNMVIKAYSNDMDKAEELLQDMIKNGLDPNEHTYDTVHHVLRRDKRIKNKEQKLAEICEQYFPSSASFHSSSTRSMNNKDRSKNNNRDNKNTQGNNNNNNNNNNRNNHPKRSSFSSNTKAKDSKW